MSSTIDNITCPECGGNGQRETDHKTGEVHNYCHDCDYEEIIEKGEEEGGTKYKLVSNCDGNNEIKLKSNTEEEGKVPAKCILCSSLKS